MDQSTLSKLTAEKLAVLNDEQKAVFSLLDEKDQTFFSTSFSVDSLPAALDKKGAILKRNKTNREKMERIKTSINEDVASIPEQNQSDDILSAVALAVGGGAAAAAVASDNSAFWQGVKPYDLIPPLQTEFNQQSTHLEVTGNQDSLNANVMILTNAANSIYGGVPALKINLTEVKNGTEVKTSDLTTQGTLETIKKGGQKILNLAGRALGIYGKSKFGMASTNDYLSAAGEVLNSGSSLAEIAGNLQIKDRAWKTIKNAAEALEKNYLDEMEKIKKERQKIEKSWDNYRNCPQCGVAFVDETCRVCGAPRPEKPDQPDPRLAETDGM